MITFSDINARFDVCNRDEVLAKLRLCRRAIDTNPFLNECVYNVLRAICIDSSCQDLKDCAMRGLQYLSNKIDEHKAAIEPDYYLAH